MIVTVFLTFKTLSRIIEYLGGRGARETNGTYRDENYKI